MVQVLFLELLAAGSIVGEEGYEGVMTSLFDQIETVTLLQH